MATLHLIVRGTVQGVGFRDALQDEARRHGVAGWVRNRRDGSVEAILQGSRESVEAVLAWARRGPPLARVTDAEVGAPAAEFQREYPGFERWPTA